MSHLPIAYPVAVGAAWAYQRAGDGRVAMAICGDGATSNGRWHEAINWSAVQRLPVIWVVNNNQFAYSTPNEKEFAVPTIAERAVAYGIPGVRVDGADVLEVFDVARDAVERARGGGGPTLIESVTLRMEGHAVHDDASYVPREMFEEWSRRDPIERFRTWLRDNASMTLAEEDEISAGVKKLLNDSLARAEESPLPDPSTLLDGVYASRDELETPHHK